MIQFNLLPDVKLEYIKAERSRRLVIGLSVLVCAAAVVLLAVLLSVDGLQKKHLSDLNRDITNETNQLQGKPNINGILTVQNQLESLTALHNAKPAASRLFDYLNEVTPATVSITNFTTDFTQFTMTLTGTSDSLASVTQYVDTLKLTAYNTGDNSTKSPAFSNVVLSSFSLNSNANSPGQAATYTIALSYDRNIFDITQNIALSVPSVTTRAQIQNPSNLFQASSGTAAGSGGQ
jgi:Tfp pilus assembly protein PilN